MSEAFEFKEYVDIDDAIDEQQRLQGFGESSSLTEGSLVDARYGEVDEPHTGEINDGFGDTVSHLGATVISADYDPSRPLIDQVVEIAWNSNIKKTD